MLAGRGLPMQLGFRIADQWRALYQPTMEDVRARRREYVSLDILQRENLDQVITTLQLENAFTGDERDVLNQAWDRLPAWSDTVDALTALAQTMQIGACSNGSTEMMRRLARHAALPWHSICGADIARTFKPEPEVYIRSCEKLSVERTQAVMVACHPDDLDAAAQAGLMTAYFPRPGEYGNAKEFIPESAPDRFDFADDTLGTLCGKLIASA